MVRGYAHYVSAREHSDQKRQVSPLIHGGLKASVWRTGRPRQRQVLDLGELNDAQHDGWVHAIEGRGSQPRQLALFPDDRDSVPVLDCEAVHIRIDQTGSFKGLEEGLDKPLCAPR
jgi:hypothetical protein